MFRSKNSMQQHANKHINKTALNRFSTEPSESHNDIEAHMQTLGQIHKPIKPPFHSFIHHNSSPSTSGHAQSSWSQALSPEHASPDCSSLPKRTYSESTLDSENYVPDEYQMKLLEEVEIADKQGNILRTQKMSTKDVCRLKGGEKILIHVNEFHQPIKASRGLCTCFMTLLLKQPNMCPIEAKDWREVKTGSGVRLLGALWGKFSIPQGKSVAKVVFTYFDDKYRPVKYRRKLMVFQLVAKRLNEANNIGVDDPQDIEILQALDLVVAPVNVGEHQWELYKSNLRSTTTKNQANQEILKKISEIGGSELVDLDKRSVIERDVMIELMGPDRSGRARGYGEGLTKSQVTNLSYDLRRMRGERFTNQNQVGTLLVQVESQRKQLESQNKLIESQNRQIESQNKKIDSQDQQIMGLHQTVDDFRNEFRLFQSVFQDKYDPRIIWEEKV